MVLILWLNQSHLIRIVKFPSWSKLNCFTLLISYYCQEALASSFTIKKNKSLGFNDLFKFSNG